MLYSMRAVSCCRCSNSDCVVKIAENYYFFFCLFLLINIYECTFIIKPILIILIILHYIIDNIINNINKILIILHYIIYHNICIKMMICYVKFINPT